MDHILMRQDKNGINGLKSLISLLPDNIVGLEIGCYAGESSEIFVSSGKFTKLYCLDFWKEGFYQDRGTSGAEKLFDAMASKYPCIDKVKANSNDVLKLFKDIHLDFIYIDGGHEFDQVSRDIHNALKLLKGKGHIAGHDYVPEFPGVQKAVNDKIYPCVFFVDSSWMKQL